MVCKECGSPVEQTDRHCPGCGKELKKTGEILSLICLLCGLVSFPLSNVLVAGRAVLIGIPLASVAILLGCIAKIKGNRQKRVTFGLGAGMAALLLFWGITGIIFGILFSAFNGSWGQAVVPFFVTALAALLLGVGDTLNSSGKTIARKKTGKWLFVSGTIVALLTAIVPSIYCILSLLTILDAPNSRFLH